MKTLDMVAIGVSVAGVAIGGVLLVRELRKQAPAAVAPQPKPQNAAPKAPGGDLLSGIAGFLGGASNLISEGGNIFTQVESLFG